MKITDKLGRSLNVDVVVKAPRFDMWMEPLGYNLTDSDRQFLRVPEGPFALRVMSRLGADVLVHLNGRLLLAAAVPKGVQYLEKDQDGKLLSFGGQVVSPSADAGRSMPAEDDLDGISGAATTGDSAAGAEAGLQEPGAVPGGEGVLFVAASLADDPIYGSEQPPRQQLTATFQLRTPEEHDKSLAGSLSRMVQPALPDEPDEVFKERPDGRPDFVCSCTGKGHAH